MPLDAGRLRSRIQFEAPTKIAVAGETRRTWASAFWCWAECHPASAKDVETARSEGVAVDWRVTIRYRTDITSEMRIRYGSSILQMVGKPRDVRGEHVALEIFCREVDV